MKMFRFILVFFVTVLAACAAGLGDLQAPNVTLASIAPAENMTVFEQRSDLTLRIQNTNNVDLPVSGLSYVVTFNGEEFARGVSNERLTVPALGEKLMRVTVTSGPLDWMRQLVRLQGDPALTPSYKVEGILYLDDYAGRKLPFSKTGEFVAKSVQAKP